MQKKLDGTTDCRKKGTAIIRYTGKNPQILQGLQEVHQKYPCVRMTVNGKKLEENPKKWDGGA